MCGRFAFYSPAEAVTKYFGVADVPEIEARYNIAPTQSIPVVRDVNGANVLSMLHWGLVPFWAKEKAIGNRMINARAETVSEKPAYRAAFRRRRCLIPATGFYEWKKVADGKQPFLIAMRDERPFAFAGLWETWKNEDPDNPLESCVIVTTNPNEQLSDLHNRMPVILRQQDHDTWLRASPDDAATLMQPYPDDDLVAWSVSKRVNSPKNEGRELIERMNEAEDGRPKTEE